MTTEIRAQTTYANFDKLEYCVMIQLDHTSYFYVEVEPNDSECTIYHSNLRGDRMGEPLHTWDMGEYAEYIDAPESLAIFAVLDMQAEGEEG